MLRTILLYGAIAGLIVAVPMVVISVFFPPETMMEGGHLAGYLTMVIALSVIFLGLKGYRDRVLGGVIKFLPAFLIGLGISAVAAVFYVIGWEICLAATDYAFMDGYAQAMIEAERAKGVSGPALEAFIAEQQRMAADYKANVPFRLGITFLEIFPVGLIISLISALLLRNSRFLPARRSPAAV